MFDATTANELPDHMRRSPGLYEYLATMPDYWRHALDVAHALLDRHAASKGNEIYYQDNFGNDFIAALEFDEIARPLVITSLHEVSNRLGGLQRNEDPAWRTYLAAVADLKSRPRGTQLLVHRTYDTGSHWEARIHTGAGRISECKTMTRFTEQPAAEQAVRDLLQYEGYLARQHAQNERLILANYRSIRELGLRPGMLLKDVELPHNGRTRKFSFEIENIFETGALKLANGKLRGSRNTFAGTKEASRIGRANLVSKEAAACA